MSHMDWHLGRAIARLLAGEWSRIEVEYEPIRTTVPGAGAPAVAFLVVGGLVLDVGVRRLLRLEGLAAPPFGSAFVWLAEGESHAVAGAWSARVTSLPGRGHLIRFGRPDASHWGLAVADPLPGLDPVRRRIPGADDEGAFRSWSYALAVDAALDNLSARGLLAPPIEGVVSIRVADPALAGI